MDEIENSIKCLFISEYRFTNIWYTQYEFYLLFFLWFNVSKGC